MKRKTISLLLVLVMLLSSMAACGESDADTITDDTAAAETETVKETTELEARLALPDNLPEKDFDGYDFRVLTRNRDDFIKDVGADLELTGDVFNDALYNRNKTLEERFNFILSAEYAENNGTATHAAAQAAVLAGDDTYDVVENQVTQMAGTCTSGIYMDWYTQLPYVDLTQPWYIGNAAEALSVNGHAYAMIGEFCLDVLRFTYCMYYNQDIAAEYDFENIFDVVKDGRWNYDYLKMLADTVYVDLNADGIKDFGDRLAISGDPYSAVVTYQYAFDNPVASLDENGLPYLSQNREKAHDIVVKLNALYWESIGGLTEGWGSGGDTWKAGNLLCYTGLFSSATGYGDLEFNFSIIPYPKYDDNQDSYYTMADGAHGTMMVPITISDPERTSIIIEALNAETYKQVVPAYYDTALKNRYSRDAESAEMLDLLMGCRVFDFGYMYDTGIAFSIQRLVSKNSNNTESEYASQIKKAETEYVKIIEEYTKLEDSLN